MPCTHGRPASCTFVRTAGNDIHCVSTSSRRRDVHPTDLHVQIFAPVRAEKGRCVTIAAQLHETQLLWGPLVQLNRSGGTTKEKGPRSIIARSSSKKNLPHEGDVDTHAAMACRAVQADEHSECRACPCRVPCRAVEADLCPVGTVRRRGTLSFLSPAHSTGAVPREGAPRTYLAAARMHDLMQHNNDTHFVFSLALYLFELPYSHVGRHKLRSPRSMYPRGHPSPWVSTTT